TRLQRRTDAAALADLQQELSLLRELEDLTIAGPIAGQPDVVLVVDVNAMLAAAGTPVAVAAHLCSTARALGEFRTVQPAAVEPFVFLRRGVTAPTPKVPAVAIPLDDGRRRSVPVQHRIRFGQRLR